jgi:phosphoglycerate dehydrogenase-like enzyme
MTETRLRAMKPGAFVINVARAEIFDEAALYEALASRRLGGAALDVWYRYPTAPGLLSPANLPFEELENVIMTPHVSGWTDGMLSARARIIAENIERTARGEVPMNAVNVHA